MNLPLLKPKQSKIHFMAISMGISRDIQVSFPISEVKSAIEKVSESSNKFYQIEKRDDVMNTYSIALIGGLAVVVPANIQLKKIDDRETQIVLTTNRATNMGNQANDIVDKFLGKVSKALSGESIDEKVVTSGKAGCFGVIVLMLILGVSILYF
jgi:hypothetical protein